MYNVREQKGSFKGLIGECMFKLTDRYVIVTKFFNKTKWLNIFSKYLSRQQYVFMANNWFSIDAVKIDFPRHKILLYEIKTKNRYVHPQAFWKTKFTQSTVNLYNEALKLDFEVKTATVWLLDNWNYEICIEDFQNADYCIDKPKLYDKY